MVCFISLRFQLPLGLAAVLTEQLRKRFTADEAKIDNIIKIKCKYSLN